ncbi:HD domain-containing phosphohydrolase [Methylomonas sp. AM2-LC]|uniref:HD domain-containing phosphohydrolase n=1 Tax=Methylomonas sp. AM2-LC TaxID=3153301 RepID=UPI003263EEA4
MISHPILIVDDEPTNLALLHQILKDDYPLIFANSGQEALLMSAKQPISMILLDIQMPEMSGYEVCSALKADPMTASIPVIFVTALNDYGNEETGFLLGCVDYLIKPVVPSLVRSRVRTHLSLVQASQLKQSQRDTIFILGEAGHYRDNDTGLHIWRMAAYSKTLAKALGWTEPNVELLELAAPMHDTGKIGIPDSILCKPGKLTPEEWKIMQTHSQIGYDILSKSDAPLLKLAAEIALHHHEKWNGTGYPNALKEKDIPESARIVAIADVFDALTMDRSYKKAWPVEQAINMIKENAAQHFDPYMVSCFMDILPQLLTIKMQWENIESICLAYNKQHKTQIL